MSIVRPHLSSTRWRIAANREKQRFTMPFRFERIITTNWCVDHATQAAWMAAEPKDCRQTGEDCYFFGIRIRIRIRLAKYAIRVGDQKRHWKKIWREVWIVQRRLTVDCKVSRIPRTVRLARKGIYIIYGPWLCFRDLPCHFLRSPCGLLEHGDRGDGHSSRMFYIFLSRRRSGFSSGSKLRLLSLQWCNPSSNLDTFYGGKQWRPSYLSYLYFMSLSVNTNT